MIEIGVEYELIDYIVKHWYNWYDYFRCCLMTTEVKFKEGLKAVDAIGENIWEYTLIEFKREEISEEDFYNIKQIIENNKYDKPMKGLLIGTSISIKVLEKVELEKNIDYFIVKDVVYNKNIKNKNKKRKYKIEEFGNIKILKKFFECSLGHHNIKLINKKDCIILRCKLNNGKQADIILFDKYCKIEVFEKSGVLYDRWNKIIDYNLVQYSEIDDIVFRIENEYCINEIRKKNDYLKENSKYFSSLGIISNYIDLYKSAYQYYFKNNMIEINSENGIVFIPSTKNNGYYIYPLKYTYILLKKLTNEKIYDIYNYNYITILESTRLILGEKVYKPLIKVSHKDVYIILELIIKLSNKKEIYKSYQINNLREVTNFEFYLIANIDIILDFERYVKGHIKNKIHIDKRYNDFIGTYKYKKYRDENTQIKTVRDIIKNLTNEDMELINRYKLY